VNFHIHPSFMASSSTTLCDEGEENVDEGENEPGADDDEDDDCCCWRVCVAAEKTVL